MNLLIILLSFQERLKVRDEGGIEDVSFARFGLFLDSSLLPPSAGGLVGFKAAQYFLKVILDVKIHFTKDSLIDP